MRDTDDACFVLYFLSSFVSFSFMVDATHHGSLKSTRPTQWQNRLALISHLFDVPHGRLLEGIHHGTQAHVTCTPRQARSCFPIHLSDLFCFHLIPGMMVQEDEWRS